MFVNADRGALGLAASTAFTEGECPREALTVVRAVVWRVNQILAVHGMPHRVSIVLGDGTGAVVALRIKIDGRRTIPVRIEAGSVWLDGEPFPVTSEHEAEALAGALMDCFERQASRR